MPPLDPLTALVTISAFVGAQLLLFVLGEVRATRDTSRQAAARLAEAVRAEAVADRERERNHDLERVAQTRLLFIRTNDWFLDRAADVETSQPSLADYPLANFALFGDRAILDLYSRLLNDAIAHQRREPMPPGWYEGMVTFRIRGMEHLNAQERRLIRGEPLIVVDEEALQAHIARDIERSIEVGMRSPDHHEPPPPEQ